MRFVSVILSPFTTLLNRFSLKIKFLFCALMFLVPFVVTGSLLVARIGDEIDRIEQVRVVVNSQIDHPAQERLQGARSELLLVQGVLTAVAVVLTLLFSSLYLSIRRNVNAIHEVVVELAQGNLEVEVALDTQDEFRVIGEALHRVVSEMSYSVLAIKQSCHGLHSLGGEMYDANREVERSATDQEQLTSHAATAVHQMASSVEEVSRNTQEAAEVAGRSHEFAIRGEAIVGQVTAAIGRLAEDVSASEAAIQRLAQDSQEITQILDTIRSIADQTNLLALNAAIEAARAGEHGRGFAVVAEEVRGLAKRTQESTLEIQSMIERLQAGADESAVRMSASAKQAGTTVQQADEAAAALHQIVEGVARISELNIQIAAATEEQSLVAEETSRNILDIAENAKQTSQLARVAFEAAAKTTSLGGEVQSLTDRFMLNEETAQHRLQSQPRLIEWSPAIELGVAEINRQHRRLVDIANELYRLSMDPYGTTAARRVMQSLVNYTATHFRYEEHLMERHGYPDLANHKEKHARLVEQVLAFKHRVDHGEEVLMELLEFVKAWLTRHIQGSDREYVPHLNGRGVH